LPAVAIAAAFCCGIALGLWTPVAKFGSTSSALTYGFILAFSLIVCGIVATGAQRVAAGAISSIICWFVLGLRGASVAEQPLPSDHILRLVDEHRIDLHSPLRWHGHLRDEPDLLPWGVGYDIDLNGVEAAAAFVPARGGLRLSYGSLPDQTAPPDLHAGDQVSCWHKRNGHRCFVTRAPSTVAPISQRRTST